MEHHRGGFVGGAVDIWGRGVPGMEMWLVGGSLGCISLLVISRR